MKKHLRWIIAIIVLAVMGVAYYYYLANKPADKDATESVADSNSELSYLVLLAVCILKLLILALLFL